MGNGNVLEEVNPKTNLREHLIRNLLINNNSYNNDDHNYPNEDNDDGREKNIC